MHLGHLEYECVPRFEASGKKKAQDFEICQPRCLARAARDTRRLALDGRLSLSSAVRATNEVHWVHAQLVPTSNW